MGLKFLKQLHIIKLNGLCYYNLIAVVLL